MNQIEFEKQLRVLKLQKSAAVNGIEKMQSEIIEESAALGRQCADMHARINRLKHQRVMVAEQRRKMEAEWGVRITQFIRENLDESRQMADVSDWALVRELRARGYTGTLANDGMTSDHVENVNHALNGDWTINDEEVR